MTVPDKIWLFRITHVDNLSHILKYGLITEHSKHKNKHFRQIGDKSIIDYRKDLDAPIPPGGKFTEYVPFYLGPRSPMLYQIATGWEDIEKINQEEIVYIVSSFDKIREHELEFFFSDGHARSDTSTKYNQKKHFPKLDWDAIYATQWRSDARDLRRQMKKQSEFLVKKHVPVACFEYLGVYDAAAHKKVLALVDSVGLTLEVRIDPKTLYYDFL
ncbi:MAG: DUF4433 domain-containing protein [Bacteroidetes bacterium]|nr:DUF4433 domain-containing protein [Bacteroidota bacterium]MBI3481491.1 DUF4433 domain-containing protein [Bacteroidota bacterium]